MARSLVGACHDRTTGVTKMIYADGGEPLEETSKALLEAGFQPETIAALSGGGGSWRGVSRLQKARAEARAENIRKGEQVVFDGLDALREEGLEPIVWDGFRSARILVKAARHDIRDKRGRFTGRREINDLGAAGGNAPMPTLFRPPSKARKVDGVMHSGSPHPALLKEGRS